MIRAILVLILVGLLTACGAGGGPERSLVEKAIALQVNQTQQELSQQLFRGSAPLSEANISQVKIKNQQRLVIEDLTAYRVQGTYDLTLELPKQRVTQRQNPFEVYLQRQIEGNWRLARSQPKDSSAEGDRAANRWITQAIE